MKRTLPAAAAALLFALAACSGHSAPTASPSSRGSSPTIGPFGARIAFCKDFSASAGIVYRPLDSLSLPADAQPVEGWVVQIQTDAKLLDAVGLSAAATQARAYADAIANYGADLKLTPPSNPDAAKKWQQRATARRTQLLSDVTTQARPFLGYCASQLHPK
jgi:hypothetical protein